MNVNTVPSSTRDSARESTRLILPKGVGLSGALGEIVPLPDMSKRNQSVGELSLWKAQLVKRHFDPEVPEDIGCGITLTLSRALMSEKAYIWFGYVDLLSDLLVITTEGDVLLTYSNGQHQLQLLVGYGPHTPQLHPAPGSPCVADLCACSARAC